MKLSNIQLLLIRVTIGGLFLSISLEKYHEGWLTTSQALLESLNNYRMHAEGLQLAYLDRVAIPFVAVWSKLICAGEMAIAVSFLLGLLTRASAMTALLMVLNFHAANGNLFSIRFFGSPWAALLSVALVSVYLARAGRWAGVDALLAKSNSKGMLW